MRNVAVITVCLLVCSTEILGHQSNTMTARPERRTLQKTTAFEYANSEKKTLKQFAVNSSGTGIDIANVDQTHQPIRIAHRNNTTNPNVEGQLAKNIRIKLCKYRNKVMNNNGNITFVNSIISKICPVAKTKTSHSNKDSQHSWKALDHTEYTSRDYEAKHILIRKKRDLNETEITVEAGDEPFDTELPQAESLIWSGPMHHLPPNRSPSIGNILGQRIANYQNRLPSQLHSPAPSLLSTRLQPSSSSNRLNSLLLNSNFKHDTIPKINSLGPSQSASSISRQYHSPENYNAYSPGPRIPPQNYYSPPPFPSLGEAGASLLKLLNPMNLFRSYTPPQAPQLPLNPNQLSHNTNHLPHNTNQLNFNSNQLRHHPSPVQPSLHEPRQPRWPFGQPLQNGDPFKENEIPPVKVKYEILKDTIQHQYGHEYVKDSPLRDDVYIGKDGNLYIKDNRNAQDADSYYEDQLSPYGGSQYTIPTEEGISNSHGRYEEQDIGQDFDGDNQYEDEYRYLLKNHNMHEEMLQDIPTHMRDFFSENAENQDNYDSNSLDFEDAYGEFQHEQMTDNQNLGQPIVQKEVPLDWVPSPPGRVNYPTYFYVPRPVALPPVYRPRPMRPLIPPRAGSPVIPPNPRFPGHNPSSSVNVHSPPHRPLSGYTGQGNHNALMPSSTRVLTRYEDLKTKRTPIPTQVTQPASKKIINGHGFYPGNGFFEADFPTLFQMSPLKQDGKIIPMPLHQNATSLVHMQNVTLPIIQMES